MSKEKKFMIIGIIILLITILGATGTYAILTWNSGKINLGLTSACFDIYYDKEQDITGVLNPSTSYTGGLFASVKFNIKSGCTDGYGKLYLVTDDTTSTNLYREGLLNYQVVKDGVATDIKGTISSSGEIKLNVGNLTKASSASTTYKIYVWINDALVQNSDANSKYSGKIRAEAYQGKYVESAATKITNLYNNASKTTVTNNGITYNYAPSEGLMNDRLGSSSVGINDGNIRYSGILSNQPIFAWQSTTTMTLAIRFTGYPFSSEKDCIDKTTTLINCSVSYEALGFSDVDTCNKNIDAALYQLTGETTLEAAQNKYCSKQEVGTDSPNYIYFNCSNYSSQSLKTCELWRIIGVFNGKVKIMRNEKIGDYSWDSSDSNVNYGDGENDWTTSDLMKLLNPGYESESVGGSLYYNKKSGNCYVGSNNITKSCNFQSTGLNEETKNMISLSTFYLGGWNNASVYSNQAYQLEKGELVYAGRPTTWKGRIAVPYPSDLSYATNLGNCSQTLDLYHDSSCTSSNWMRTFASKNEVAINSWLLNPYALNNTDVSNTSITYKRKRYAAKDEGVFPTLYLNEDVFISGGTGTSTDPYRLSV